MIQKILHITATLAMIAFAASTAFAQSPYADEGHYAVATALETWRDESRNRDVPIKLYLPQGEGPFPVVIFSHGLGGSREASPYLGEHWASHGFLGVFVQHPGTDAFLWQGASDRDEVVEMLADGIRDLDAARDRFEDIPFVVDQMFDNAIRLNADPERIGMSGHSYGAHSTLAAMGRRYGMHPRFEERRISAGVMLSPPNPPERVQERRYGWLYETVEGPLMHITGTEDVSVLRESVTAEARTIPFQHIENGPQYLIVFDGGDHSVFSGRSDRGRNAEPSWYPELQGITAEVTTAFWFAHLLEDEAARAWLNGDGLADAIRPGDQLQTRNLGE